MKMLILQCALYKRYCVLVDFGDDVVNRSLLPCVVVPSVGYGAFALSVNVDILVFFQTVLAIIVILICGLHNQIALCIEHHVVHNAALLAQVVGWHFALHNPTAIDAHVVADDVADGAVAHFANLTSFSNPHAVLLDVGHGLGGVVFICCLTQCGLVPFLAIGHNVELANNATKCIVAHNCATVVIYFHLGSVAVAIAVGGAVLGMGSKANVVARVFIVLYFMCATFS